MYFSARSFLSYNDEIVTNVWAKNTSSSVAKSSTNIRFHVKPLFAHLRPGSVQLSLIEPGNIVCKLSLFVKKHV